MSYTVLARRYRSQTFDEVVGQEPVARTLRNAIRSGRIAHAYLFCGTRGVGKTTMARILAKALNCLASDGPTDQPCCRCDSCLAIAAGEDIDVLEIDGASNNGVEHVRQLRENANYRPARSRFKIYIIDEVHMLSTSAFNALLKILEEPPSHVKFIFATTEPNKVPATIQSRCQRFDFRSLTTAEIARQLAAVLDKESIQYQQDAVLAVARSANGSMRDGLTLLDRLISVGQPLDVNLVQQYLGQPDLQLVYRLVCAIAQGQPGQALVGLDELLGYGLSELQVVDNLIDALRDLMVLKTAGADTNMVVLTAQQRELAQGIASQFDLPGLVYAITALDRIRWPIKNSETPRPLLEATIIRLAASEHFLDADLIAKRLSASIEAQPDPGPADAQKEPPRPFEMPTGQALQDRWSEVLRLVEQRLGKATAGLLAGTSIKVDGQRLTIQFPATAKVQYQMAQSNGRPQQVQRVLCEYLGSQVEVILDLQQGPANTDRQPARSAGQRILDDPIVKAVLLGLDARITGIEEQ